LGAAEVLRDFVFIGARMPFGALGRQATPDFAVDNRVGAEAAVEPGAETG
jgi:hypothetical protein